MLQLRTSLRFLVGLLVLLALAPAVLRAERRASLLTALNSITADELQSHVDVLAGDAFEGREAGSRGGQAAGGYLWQELEEAGLKPVGEDGGYFQSFNRGYRNILALLEGSDPHLSDEIILVGAHYDHVGYGNQTNSYGPFGYVHNGADDNASGTSGLLEMIDAFRRLPQTPRRSILFAFWDGEEKGLVGSKHWARNPTLPLERIQLAVNVDMIGRLKNERLEIYGARTSSGLRRLLSEQNQDEQLALDFSWEIKANSDHYTFYERSIPFLMLHTGLHDNYHRPSDDAHLINTQGLQAVSRLLFAAVFELADRDATTGFRAEAAREAIGGQSQFEQLSPMPPPRLGIRWDNESSERIIVTHVEPESAAANAGIQVGDQLVLFSGQPVGSRDQLRLSVLRSNVSTSVTVLRPGQPQPLELPVELDGKPTRIGLSWRGDDAEPGTVLVTRVVPGSPADLAGLKNRDRIYEVQSQPFADSNALLETLRTMPSPIELTIERAGRISTVRIDAPLARN